MEEITMKILKNLLSLVVVLLFAGVVFAQAVPETPTAQSFVVAVNNYPDTQSYDTLSYLPKVYINKYTMAFEGDAFKVISVETKMTENTKKPSATFEIKFGEMADFEGFLTYEDALLGAKNKKAILWTAPPYKNFGNGKICQTNYLKTNEFLGGTESYACAEFLSVPYQKLGNGNVPTPTPAPPEPKKETIDLSVTSLDLGEKNFAAKVCNLGTKSVSQFEIEFVSYTKDQNGATQKNNLLTYVPELTPNSCITIYSWPYAYFGLTKETVFSAKVNLDPANKIAETNENNNYAEYTAAPGPEMPKEMSYTVFPRSSDKTSRGIVAKYLMKDNGWSLADTDFAELSNVIIVSPKEEKAGTSYKSDISIKEGEKVLFLAFYPASEIPSLINVGNVPESAYIPLERKLVDGKLYACALNDCSKKYSSHALENLWFEGGKFYTIYQKPELAKNPDLFSGGEQKPMLPAYDETKVPVKTEPATPIPSGEEKPMLPAYDETKVPVKEDKKCLDGCKIDGKCLPIGTKIKENGQALYCSFDGQMTLQLPDGSACQNSYECLSNSCLSGKCLDLEKKLQEQQNLLDKIMAWFNRFFGSAQ